MKVAHLTITGNQLLKRNDYDCIYNLTLPNTGLSVAVTYEEVIHVMRCNGGLDKEFEASEFPDRLIVHL